MKLYFFQHKQCTIYNTITGYIINARDKRPKIAKLI